ETSLKEIKEMLAAKGLHLGQSAEEAAALSNPLAPAMELVSQPPAAPAVSDGVMSTPIDRVDFSIRAKRALENLNLKTLGDLAKKSEVELMACKNFGQTSLNEIRQKLSEYGLTLRENV
ncbi:MAG: hypothetical protein EHM48_09275, partial [Planctomycetaceae bacterium]